MARFFVDRPIVAIVISDRHRDPRPRVHDRPAHRAVPVDHPSPDPDPDHVHGRGRRDHRAVGGDPPRAADERRGQDALHAVHERERRHHDPDRHLRRGERSQHRPGERAEPRVPGPAQPARRREPVRPHLPEHGGPAPGRDLAIYSPNGTYDSLFLGNYALINVNDALYRVPGRGPGHQLRPRRVLDADLGEARQAGQARHHRPRPGARHPAAERRQSRGARGRGARAARGSSSPTPCVRKGRLVTPEEFGNVVVRITPQGLGGAPQGRLAGRARAP